MPPTGTVRVRVPATSANLGPGFDALALALTLHDEVEAWTCRSGLSIEISGEGAGLADAGEDHLVVRAMRATFAVTGARPDGIGLRCVNQIPHGRGLGSSAAAIVAGVLAARALSGTDTLPDEAVFQLAAGLEGHPDNVAACLAGGLTVAWTTEDHPRMVRLEPRAPVTPVVCIAPAPVRTEVARRLLPDAVPHRDAAANAARSALLVAALCCLGKDDPAQTPSAVGGEPFLPDLLGSPVPSWLLLAATEDRLHQDYRAAAMPETCALVRRLRAAGIPAVTSGAGPSVLALLAARDRPDYRRHLDGLDSIVRETGIAWHVSSLDIERQGARVLGHPT